MTRILTSTIVAIAILSSSALVRAESGTDAFFDNSRTGEGFQQTLIDKPVALQNTAALQSKWMDCASQVLDGGN